MNDLACVVVNFNSGRLCASAVRALRAQKLSGRDGGPGRLQIIVVDNASPEDQRHWLDPLREQGVHLVYHDRNEGYGGGMNLGMQFVDAEFVLIANPDIMPIGDTLDTLVTLMRSDPTIGAAGPRGFLDADQFIMLPPNDLPSLSLHVWESLGRVHRSIAQWAAIRRTRRFLRGWLATAPIDMEMVAGFGFLLRSDLARRLGPFDPHFPFYFEDADLCRRVRRAGYRVVLEPRARMVHFFDQSARSVRAEVQRKFEVSRGYYYRKHYGDAGAKLFGAMNRYVSRRAAMAEGWRFAPVEDLGAAAEPPTLELRRPRARYIAELATDPSFLFCGGHAGNGGSFTFSPLCWRSLEATTWFVRILDVDTLDLVRNVTFQKTTPAAGPPLFEEMPA